MARDWARLSWNDLKQLVEWHDDNQARSLKIDADLRQERDNLRETLASRDAEIRELKSRNELQADLVERLASDAANERRELQATIDDLRHATAPGSTDNGDGTTTWQGVPVTIPTGITPIAVRTARRRELYIGYGTDNSVRECDDIIPLGVRVIVAKPEPPAPTVTWQAPACLKDGEYTIDSDGDLWLPCGDGENWMVAVCGCAKPGRYKVVDGVGTWIGEA